MYGSYFACEEITLFREDKYQSPWITTVAVRSVPPWKTGLSLGRIKKKMCWSFSVPCWDQETWRILSYSLFLSTFGNQEVPSSPHHEMPSLHLFSRGISLKGCKMHGNSTRARSTQDNLIWKEASSLAFFTGIWDFVKGTYVKIEF